MPKTTVAEILAEQARYPLKEKGQALRPPMLLCVNIGVNVIIN